MTADGAWQIYSTFVPSLLDAGLASIRRELDKWPSNGLKGANFPHQVSALTLDQGNEVIRRRLDPAKMNLVKSGSLR